MDIEIIICTKNRPSDLSNALNSILIQTVKAKKVVIVDSGSSSMNYAEIEKLFSDKAIEFKVIRSRAGLTYQRNIGITQIEYELILFLDDDVILEDNYLINLQKVFILDTNKSIGGATGRITNYNFKPGFISTLIRKIFILPLTKRGEILSSGFANGIDYNLNDSIEVGWLSGSNMIYRREVFDFNWFDENLKGYSYAEDLDFSYRISKSRKLVYCPEAKLKHCVSASNRLNDKVKAEMFVLHHHYLFKKNFKQSIKNRFAHLLSLKGILLQKLLLERTWQGFKGAFWGIIQILFLKNFKYPNYLERLDFNRPHKIQIAEHIARYNFIKEKCKDKVVLDCASGEGIGVDILKAISKKVVGVDIDLDAITRAQTNVKGSNVEFVHGSALELPFEDEVFDVVTSVETLEHIPVKFHPQLISEFHRVLKKGGLLYLTTPNKDITSSHMVSARNYFHIAEIGYEKLKSLLESKFTNLNVYGIFNPIRDIKLDKIGEQVAQVDMPKLTAKKAILLMTPLAIKDLFSVLVKKRHIYPTEGEYIFKNEGAEYSANLITVCQKP